MDVNMLDSHLCLELYMHVDVLAWYLCFGCSRFKALADKRKVVADADLLALLSDELHQPKTLWELADLQV
jgi:hypothetical protein